jgi:hypothetical protein
MSTKTTFKRIALVAVAALGLGVLTSVAPANAAATALTAGTPAPARVSVAGGSTTITITGAVTTTDFSAQITSAPATSTSAVLAFAAGTATVVSSAPSVVTNQLAADNTVGTDSGTVGDGIAVANLTGTTGQTVKVTLNADVAGTYQILVTADSAAGYVAGKVSTNYTVTTTGAPVSITASSVNGAVVDGGTKGQLFKATLKDANGNATVLGLNESIAISESSSALQVVAASAVAGGTELTAIAPSSDVAGVYYFRAVDAGTVADGSVVITLTGAGLLPSTLTTNFTATTVAATAAVGTETITVTTATSYTTAGLDFSADYGSTGSSHSFTVTKAAAPDADTVNPILVTPQLGANYAYNTSVKVLADATTGKFSVTQALASTDLDGFSVALADGSRDKEVAYEAPAADVIAIQGQASVLSATGGKNTFTVKVSSQYAVAMAYQAVTVTVAGRNTVATTALGVTDANGLISYSLTDAGTTGSTDTVTFATTATTTASAAATINYGTVTVSTVTVTGGATADTIAGTTKSAINGADNGPEASRVEIKAVVKDASGNLLAGVPVVFTVDSGLVYKTAAIDYATVYTGSNGAASTYVFDWKVGKQTVTATAGGVAKTGYINWVASDATSARVLSATATGDIVSLMVVDRFGNAVQGVTINLSRTGAGLFGNGASTQNIDTDKNGTADVRFTGSGTVVAELAATYAQAYDVAGEIAETAVTAAVAGTTKGTGASLAPAGVAKVSVAIEAGADSATTSAAAAADAAAEATDAANAATDAANAAAEAADAATAAAQDAADAVAALSTQVATYISNLRKQITALTNLVIKIQKKVRA